MNFVEAVKACFQKYAIFRGRAPRSEFWWFVLFNFIAGAVLSAIYAPLSAIFTLATLIPYIAVTWRRLHDIDRPGRWMLLPVFGSLVGALTYSLGLGMISPIFPLGATIWLLVLCIKTGTAGNNRFGPPPLTGEPSAQAA